MWLRGCAILATVAGAACSRSQLYATPPPGTTVDTFQQSSVAKSDILWIIGNHGSMANEQAALAAAFPRFFAHMQESKLDYRIAVTTSDIENTAGRLVGQPQVIVGNSQDPNVLDAADPQAAFEANVKVGTTGSARDESLEAASMALSQLGADAQAAQQAGRSVLFLRPDAALFLIFVGDGPDYSPNEPRYYWRLFQQAKGIGNNAEVAVSAIAGDLPNGCCPLDCCSASGSGCADQTCCASLWCLGTACCENALSESCFPAAPGLRYYEVVELAGGIFGSICSASFDTQLDQLGLQALGLTRKFRLSHPADPSTLQVEIDYPCATDPNNLLCTTNRVTSTCTAGVGGQCDAGCSDTLLACTPPEISADAGVTAGWSYEASDSAIVFVGDIPALGSVIKVSYTIAGGALP